MPPSYEAPATGQAEVKPRYMVVPGRALCRGHVRFLIGLAYGSRRFLGGRVLDNLGPAIDLDFFRRF